MRVFPRIGYRGLAARGRRRLHPPRGPFARPARVPPATLLLIVPPVLLAASCLAYARGLGAVAVLLPAAAAAAVSAGQGVALRRLWRRLPLGLSSRDGDDRRFLLDLGAGVRAASSVGQLYEQVAGKVAREFGVERVSLLIRDDATGEFVCRATCATPPRPQDSPGGLPDAGAPRLAGDDFVVRRLRHLTAPLAVEPRSFDLWARSAAPEGMKSREREAAVLRRLDARMLIQLRARERMTGLLALGPRTSGRAYTPEEKLVLLSVAGQLALVVENSKLLERMVEEERLRRELAMAAEVQRRLFPERPPVSAAFELAGYCEPARKVGGDYYDFLAFDGGQTGLVVADVAGKGISAALLMSTLRATLRAQVAGCRPDASRDGSLAELVSTLNRLLCQATGPASFVTFFYAQFDQTTRRLAYVNAGHNPPLLLRAGGPDEFCQLEPGGTVVGIFEHCAYEQETVQMLAGDVLLAYTDGLTEAMSASGEEFGEARLREALRETAGLPADEMRDEIVGRVRDWCADAPQHDDLTLVVMKVK